MKNSPLKNDALARAHIFQTIIVRIVMTENMINDAKMNVSGIVAAKDLFIVQPPIIFANALNTKL